MNKDRNTLYLDTDLEGEEFQTYVNNKKVGDDVDFHVRGRIKSMDETSIAVSVETVFKIEGWENPESGEPEEDADDLDEDESEDEEESTGKPKSPKVMAIIFSGSSKKNKKSSQSDSVY